MAAIQKSVDILGPKFVFGYYDIDDLTQDCFIYTAQLFAKGKYDPTRPLENYIYRHLKNRLINKLRDKLHRNDPPCKQCHRGEPCRTGNEYCTRYATWKARNSAKANIMRPLDITNVADERERRTRVESKVESEVMTTELYAKIDEALPVELRSAFLQILAGVSVSKSQRDEVAAAVHEIIGWSV